MKPKFDSSTRKRAVNLTLNESLVTHARALTDNLSGVVESLLADFVSRANRERLHKAKSIETALASWNEFNSNSGSIADEYSTL